MASPKEPFEAGNFYHVQSNANGKENLFVEKENYRFFLSKF